MGFWSKLLGLEDEENTDTKKIEAGKESKIDTTFVTNQEEDDFSTSMFGQLELLEADVGYIEEVLPLNGAELRNQIVLLRQLLLVSNNEQDPKAQAAFSSLKTQFEEDRRMADGEYTLRQLEQQNVSMDRMFEKSLRKDGITKQKLDEYIEYIKKLQEKVNESDLSEAPILKGVKRQKFNEISMRSEYRIKMLELMYLLNNGDIDINPFKNLSPLKQKMFSKYFFEDAKNAAQQYDMLSYFEEAFNSEDTYDFRLIDQTAKILNSKMEDAVVTDDFSIMELFDSENPSTESFEFLKNFVKFKSKLNDMRERKDGVLERYNSKIEAKRKKEEEEAERIRKAQEAEIAKQEAERKRIERYKTMTNEEINEEIYRIEHDLKATGNRFVNILEFQKEIARARGLLPNEQELQNDELVYKTMNSIQVVSFLKEAKKSGVNFTILPDTQEFKNKSEGYLVIVSKTDENALKPKSDAPDFTNVGSISGWRDITFGRFPAWVLNHLNRELSSGKKKISDKLAVQKCENGLYELSYYYSQSDSGNKARKEKEKTVYDTLKELLYYLPCMEGITEKSIKDIMCYIQTPAVRNIIPILEQFQKSEVSAFLEPVPAEKRNTNSRDNINIYFRREDLEKVVSDILPKISGNKGIAILKRDRIDLGRETAGMSVWEDEKTLKEL